MIDPTDPVDLIKQVSAAYGGQPMAVNAFPTQTHVEYIISILVKERRVAGFLELTAFMGPVNT